MIDLILLLITGTNVLIFILLSLFAYRLFDSSHRRNGLTALMGFERSLLAFFFAWNVIIGLHNLSALGGLPVTNTRIILLIIRLYASVVYIYVLYRLGENLSD